MSHILRITVAQYELRPLKNWDEYAAKIESLVKLAKQDKAEMLTFAEYAGLELASWKPTAILAEQFEHIQTLLEKYIELYQSLAAKYQMYLQPGTIPVKTADNYFRNRAFFFGPQHSLDFQDKMHLVPAEVELGYMQPGTELKKFETRFGAIGINISYDSEFPLLAHELTAAGVNLILVPSRTETQHGYTRISISCRARAIENQCYIVQSSLAGQVNWCNFITENVGHSGVYTPADIDFPPHGILAQATANLDELLTVDLDLGKTHIVRQHGQVRNFNDMQTHIKRKTYSVTAIKV